MLHVGATPYGSGVAEILRRDPVCGMWANHAHARELEYAGASYSFCSRSREDEFARDPERFLRATRALLDTVTAERRPRRVIRTSGPGSNPALH